METDTQDQDSEGLIMGWFIAKLRVWRGRQPARIEVYHDTKGEWRWRLKATNGKIIADSGEGYINKQDCLDTLARIIKGVKVEGFDVI